jgi:hypothetical protein
LNEAYLEGFRAATDLWRELLLARRDPRTHAFEIADVSGKVLLVLPFSEILEATNPARKRATPRAAFTRAQATAERNAMLTGAIVTEIRAARNHLAQSQVLLRALDSRDAKTSDAFGPTSSR